MLPLSLPLEALDHAVWPWHAGRGTGLLRRRWGVGWRLHEYGDRGGCLVTGHRPLAWGMPDQPAAADRRVAPRGCAAHAVLVGRERSRLIGCAGRAACCTEQCEAGQKCPHTRSIASRRGGARPTRGGAAKLLYCLRRLWGFGHIAFLFYATPCYRRRQHGAKAREDLG